MPYDTFSPKRSIPCLLNKAPLGGLYTPAVRRVRQANCPHLYNYQINACAFISSWHTRAGTEGIALGSDSIENASAGKTASVVAYFHKSSFSSGQSIDFSFIYLNYVIMKRVPVRNLIAFLLVLFNVIIIRNAFTGNENLYWWLLLSLPLLVILWGQEYVL